jgi:hypothetical protein
MKGSALAMTEDAGCLYLSIHHKCKLEGGDSLEQPISPERFSSLTQGKLSMFRYIAFTRSGTDSNVAPSPIK